jgi:hypothetical protein
MTGVVGVVECGLTEAAAEAPAPAANANVKGDLLIFLTKCGCKTSPAEIFHTNQHLSHFCEVRVSVTGEDGEEKICSEFSDPRDDENSAELSGIVKWMAKFPELCSIPSSELASAPELRKLTFMKQLLPSALPKVTYACDSGFLCTVRVPRGDNSLSAQSSVCRGKKEAEANAAKNWLETHKSAYEISSQLKGLSSSSHLRSLIHDWCCWCCRMWSD